MPNYTLSQQQLENTWSLHKHDLLPKEKVTWKFSPTENRFGIRKDFALLFDKLSNIEIIISEMHINIDRGGQGRSDQEDV
jgi:hypothetical protein